MKKESKNTGISKACPKCRKMIIGAANLTGIGSWRVKCPYCGALIKADIILQLILTALTILLLLTFAFPYIVQYKRQIVEFVTERE